jgi:hypothetical protein
MEESARLRVVTDEIPARAPLGEVLVERGLLTPGQLDTALTEQSATGRPLGEIVVGLGLATPPDVALALAAQHGGALKTEYGFAVSSSAPPTSDVGAPPVTAQPPVPTEPVPVIGDPAPPLAEQQQQQQQQPTPGPVPVLGDPAPPLPEPQQPATPFAAPPEAVTPAPMVAVEAAAPPAAVTPAPAVAVEAMPAAVGDHLELLGGTVATLQGETLRLRADLAELGTARREAVDALEAELAAARAELSGLAARIAELEAELATPANSLAQRAARFAACEHHTIFVAGSEGYELHEVHGPPPMEGTTITLPGELGAPGLHTVTRVAAASPDGRPLPCAYLLLV